MRDLKGVFRSKKRELVLTAVIVVVAAVFQSINGAFLRFSNIANIFSGYAVYGIMAMGMMLVIGTGNIDVSVGAQLAVVSMIIGSLVSEGWITGVPEAVLASVFLGLALGLVNGLFVAVLKLPAIIVTLGTLNIMRGILLLVLGSSWVSGLPSWFSAIARTAPFGLRFKMTAYVWLAVCCATYLLGYHTVLGRKLLAVGANPEGAARIGFSPSSTYIFAFSAMGAASGLAALFYTANVGIAQPVAGIGYEMTLIAAVVIGGTSFSGGRVSVLGTYLGILLLSTIESGMVISKVPVYWQELVKGAVIIIAIASAALDSLSQRRRLHPVVATREARA